MTEGENVRTDPTRPTADGPVLPPERPRPRPSRPDGQAPARPRPRPRASAAADGAPVGAADDAPDVAPDVAPVVADDGPPAVEEKPKSRHAKVKRADTKPAETAETEQPGRRRNALRGKRWVRFAIKLAIAVVVAAVVALVLRAYVIAPYYIPSASMEPTLKGGGGDTDDRILVDKVTYRIHEPHEGDIVVFDRPVSWHINDQTLVKRIIGLPGDVVSLRGGLVYVNGMRLRETYLNKACGPAPTKPLTSTATWTVPMGDYFVMGDNRCNSDDSRHYGPVPRSKIVGHVVLIVWPLSRFGSP